MVGAAYGACPNFKAYAVAPMENVDNDKWLEEAIKPVVKIDRRVTGDDLEKAFECVLQRNLPKVKQVFGKKLVMLDSNIYQFPASGYAYGRILVTASRYFEFTQKKLSLPITIMKLNFDFDKEGRVIDQDVFVIEVRPDRLVYSEYIAGVLTPTERCFKCHNKSKDSGVFFKDKYAGLRHVGAVRELPQR